jgi:hypothetical protein
MLFACSVTACGSAVRVPTPSRSAETSTPAYTATPTREPAWIVYEQPALGVRFEYPSGYDAIGCGPNLSSSPEQGVDLRLGYRITLHRDESDPNGAEEAANEFIDAHSPQDLQETNRSTIDISSQSALRIQYRFGGTGRYGESIFLVREGKLLRLDFSAGQFCDLPDEGITEGQVFERIISTLQFLD